MKKTVSLLLFFLLFTFVVGVLPAKAQSTVHTVLSDDEHFAGEFLQRSPAVALKGEDGFYRLAAESRFAIAFDVPDIEKIQSLSAYAIHPSFYDGVTLDTKGLTFRTGYIFEGGHECASYAGDKCVTEDFSLHYSLYNEDDFSYILNPEITRYPMFAYLFSNKVAGLYFIGYLDVVFVDEPEVLPANGEYSFDLSKTAANGKSGVIFSPLSANANVQMHRGDSFSLKYIPEETECVSMSFYKEGEDPFVHWQSCAADHMLSYKGATGGEHSSIYWKLRDSIEYYMRNPKDGGMIAEYPTSSIFPAIAADDDTFKRLVLDESYFLDTSGKFMENGTILEIPGLKLLKSGNYMMSVSITKTDGTLYNAKAPFFVQYTDNVAVEDPAEAKISVYPNPAETNVRLEFDGCDGVCLYNALGQKLYQDKGQDAFDINLQEYPAGLYILHATKGDKTYKKKVIKK